LLLSDRVSHLTELMEMLRKEHPTKQLRQYFSGLRDAVRDEIDLNRQDVILATYSIYGTGKDVPWLNCLIFCTPRSDVFQISGRLRNGGLIIDIVDRHYISRQKQRHVTYQLKEFKYENYPVKFARKRKRCTVRRR